MDYTATAQVAKFIPTSLLSVSLMTMNAAQLTNKKTRYKNIILTLTTLHIYMYMYVYILTSTCRYDVFYIYKYSLSVISGQWWRG